MPLKVKTISIFQIVQILYSHSNDFVHSFGTIFFRFHPIPTTLTFLYARRLHPSKKQVEYTRIFAVVTNAKKYYS